MRWEQVRFETPEELSLEQDDWPEAVANGPGGFVAVGSNHDITNYVGRIWHSEDALDWRLVETPLLDGLELTDVVASETTFVAVGHRSANPNHPITSVLTSADGATWAEATTFEDAWAVDVAVGPQGFALVLAVEETTDILLSPDGSSWTRVAGADIAPNMYLPNIEWAGDGWIAVGSTGNRALLLRSPDGVGWEEERLPASEPIDGIYRVSAYRVIPGRWATLVLGIDFGAVVRGGRRLLPQVPGRLVAHRGDWLGPAAEGDLDLRSWLRRRRPPGRGCRVPVPVRPGRADITGRLGLDGR